MLSKRRMEQTEGHEQHEQKRLLKQGRLSSNVSTVLFISECLHPIWTYSKCILSVKSELRSNIHTRSWCARSCWNVTTTSKLYFVRHFFDNNAMFASDKSYLYSNGLVNNQNRTRRYCGNKNTRYTNENLYIALE